jgi:nicotinamidase-related amidase
MMQAGHAGAPLLICLNLQRTYIDPQHAFYAPRGAEALVNVGACLAWARRREMPVWHIHTQSTGARALPIPGFEPRPCERVLTKQSWSLFDSAEVVCARPALERAFVVGFTAAKDCLAAAIDAERAGVRLVFITDAIASPPMSNQPIEIFEDVLASLLGAWAVGVTTADLMRHQHRLVAQREAHLEP